MHRTTPRFWQAYEALTPEIQKIADHCYQLLNADPAHPSLHFKKVGKYWSVRAGLNHRALGLAIDEGILWFWIGIHEEYVRIIGRG
jgi:hypothetical protein